MQVHLCCFLHYPLDLSYTYVMIICVKYSQKTPMQTHIYVCIQFF